MAARALLGNSGVGHGEPLGLRFSLRWRVVAMSRAGGVLFVQLVRVWR
jgi:hypothetical protein